MSTTSRGAYTRQGADEPDAAIFAAAMDFIRAVPTQPTMADLLAPPVPGSGVDWDALGVDQVPDWVSGASPAVAALREIEPPTARRWRHLARPEQLPPPGDWLYWLVTSGRGWGKTFAGANVLAEWATKQSGDYALIAPTFADARKVCVEGHSGLLAALGDDVLSYNKSDYIVYVKNGSRIILASSDVPDRLRGYSFCGAWLDELSSFTNTRDLWDLALLPALRKGRLPQTVITTTPKRGNPLLRELIDRATAGDPVVRLTRGRTMDNKANLSKAFLDEIHKRYAGSSAGRQELEGELLDSVEGALVNGELIEATRLYNPESVPILRRVVVAVDPAVSNNEGSDYTGIVVVGIGPAPAGWEPPNGLTVLHGSKHAYLLEDASLKASPETWARKVLTVADEWDADQIIAEVNQGHDLVSTTVQLVARAGGMRHPRIRQVTASKSKVARAEPIAGLWEQHRVHVVGTLPRLEDEWCSFVPGESTKSPDRLDASVWGIVGVMPELGMKARPPMRVIAS